MKTDWQTWIALLVVAIAATLLLRSAFSKKKKHSCGSGLGCPTDDFKKRLAQARRGNR